MTNSTVVTDAVPETPVETKMERAKRLQRERYARNKTDPVWLSERTIEAARRLRERKAADPVWAIEEKTKKAQQQRDWYAAKKLDPVWLEKYQTEQNARERLRYQSDSEYAAGVRARKSETHKRKYATDPDYATRHKARHLARHKERYATDPNYRERRLKASTERDAYRLKTDAGYAAERRLRNNLRDVLRKASTIKTSRTARMLGCSPAEAFQHLLSTQLGATCLKGWHIDHILPIAAFDHAKEGWEFIGNNYMNLQLLTPADNLAKLDSVPKYVPAHILPWLKQVHQEDCLELDFVI